MVGSTGLGKPILAIPSKVRRRQMVAMVIQVKTYLGSVWREDAGSRRANREMAVCVNLAEQDNSTLRITIGDGTR